MPNKKINKDLMKDTGDYNPLGELNKRGYNPKKGKKRFPPPGPPPVNET